jgi:hypothetical protein
MPNLTSVGISSGVPNSGTGTVSTLDALMADGGQATIGAIADAAVTAGASGTASAKLRSISRDVASRSQLHNTGSSNGSIIAPLTLTAGADLASLASGSAVTLTGGGAAGVSSQTNTGSGKTGLVYFQTVTAGFTPTAGGNISIWWLFSPDGGTTYETTPATASATVPALPRPPDCIIPLDAAALGTAAVKVSLPCNLPYGTFKAVVQNNSGAAFGAGNYTLKLVAFAENN